MKIQKKQRSQERSLRLIFLLFAVFLSAQALSGIFLFATKIGYSLEQLTEYFQGAEEKFVLAKSFWGMLEIAVFHLGGICLYALFISHFLFVFPTRAKVTLWIIYGAALGDILSGFFIRYLAGSLAVLKAVFFVLFEMATLYFVVALVVELLSGFFSQRHQTRPLMFR